ncbi:MAG: TIGR01212 family radical SAM protein [Ruminococcaceae bacterium]|nr:TIGR01212 family radical SAM protein [Oscillospiraceae bacterium]
MKYKTLNEHYRERFGCKVYKLSLNAGFTCPNRDGTCGMGGCIFCSASGSGEFAEKFDGDIAKQLENAKKRVNAKIRNGKFIAYFQSFTNTYADVKTLERLYMEAIKPDYIVGLSVATRPDCLADETVSLLKRINGIKPVSVELGLQTTNEKTARYIRRGYETSVYFDAVKRLKSAGLEVVTHIIIGLPMEDMQTAVETTRQAVKIGTDGVKFHLLHVLKNTDLAIDYANGKFNCLSLAEYAEILCECIKQLKPETVVHRITGDGAKSQLIAPLWSADKKYVLNFLNNYLSKNL